MFEATKLATLGKEITVLYVEDDIDLASPTKSFLEKFFVAVESAKDGEEALKLYKEHRHDLVITDIKMPKVNGLELVRHIKTINPNQTVIAISAYDFAEFAEPGAHKRFDKFLQKPVQFNELVITLEQICEKILDIKSAKTPNPVFEMQIITLEDRVKKLEDRVAELTAIIQKMAQ